MTRYLSLAEYLWLSEQVTGVSAEVLSKSSRIELADSALHAPMAGFGGEDFYPDIVDKAAVLCWRRLRLQDYFDGAGGAVGCGGEGLFGSVEGEAVGDDRLGQFGHGGQHRGRGVHVSHRAGASVHR